MSQPLPRFHAVYGSNPETRTAICVCGVELPEDVIDQHVTEANAPVSAGQEPTHVPCCSSHGVAMTCARYRRTHFVEVRPCCSTDARALAAELVTRTADLPADQREEARAAKLALIESLPAAPESLLERTAAAIYDANPALFGNHLAEWDEVSDDTRELALLLSSAALHVVTTSALR